jgi:hypothetical protein
MLPFVGHGLPVGHSSFWVGIAQNQPTCVCLSVCLFVRLFNNCVRQFPTGSSTIFHSYNQVMIIFGVKIVGQRESLLILGAEKKLFDFLSECSWSVVGSSLYLLSGTNTYSKSNCSNRSNVTILHLTLKSHCLYNSILSNSILFNSFVHVWDRMIIHICVWHKAESENTWSRYLRSWSLSENIIFMHHFLTTDKWTKPIRSNCVWTSYVLTNCVWTNCILTNCVQKIYIQTIHIQAIYVRTNFVRTNFVRTNFVRTKLFGQTMFGQTLFGQTLFGQTLFGQTLFGQTLFGQTLFGQTSFGQTTFGQSAFWPSANISMQANSNNRPGIARLPDGPTIHQRNQKRNGKNRN